MDDLQVERCTSEGDAWETLACDTGEVCFAERCRPAEACTPGETRCPAEAREARCDESGRGFVEEVCNVGERCLGGMCREADCTPNENTCQGDDVVTCNAEGFYGDVIRTCAAGACQGGRCIEGCILDFKGVVGCEFFAAKLDHMSPGDREQFGVTVSNVAPTPVAVTVTGGDGSEVTSLTVQGGSLQTIELPRQDVKATSRSFNSFRISADGPVTVHQFNPLNRSGVASTDASLLFPSTSLGTEYVVMGWPSYRQGSSVPEGRAYVTIIASEDDTEVRFTTTATIDGSGPVPDIAAGASWETTLARGEVISFGTPNATGHDLTGSRVESNRPIAVFFGHMCADVPLPEPSRTCCCDHLEQQLMPLETLGSEIIAPKFASRGSEVDIWRILAVEDDTQVTLTPAIGGVSDFVLGAGEVREVRSNQSFIANASAPILVGQFMVGENAEGVEGGFLGLSGIGDPAFTLNVGAAQYVDEYIVLVPGGFTDNHLALVVRDGESVQLNGTPITSAAVQSIPGSPWEVWYVEVNSGVQRLTGSAAFGLSVHGYSRYVSYAYPGGMNLEAR